MNRLKPILTIIILLSAQFCFAQKLSSVDRWVDSINHTINEIRELAQFDSVHVIDSFSLSKKFTGLLKLDTPKLEKPSIDLTKEIPIASPKRVIDFKGGFINYNWNYRSSVDTPFQEKNLSQHFLNTSLNFTIAQSIPIEVSYFDRESNSKYFRNYRDFRVEFNTQEFSRLQTQKLSAYTEQLTNKLRNPLTKTSLDYVNKQLDKIENWENQRDVLNQVKDAKFTVLNGGTIDTVNHKKDTSTVSKAKAFLALYDDLTKKTESLKLYRDSLQKDYVKAEKEIALVRKIVNGNQQGIDKKEAIQGVLNRNGIEDRRLERLYSAASSIRTLAIGKTVPNYSELTLKNINVNGINFEYNRGVYFALAAGAIDYRARDFFYSKVRRKPQFVYLARFGYGTRERSHFYLTAFSGKKQVLSSAETPVTQVYGLSFESQLAITRNNKIIGEIAQSASPSLINSNGLSQKPSLNFKDEKNRAYSVKLNSYVPKLRLRLEAFYKYRGINYQNFSSYYTNAALNQWSVRADQYMFRRMLRINLSAAKNTYENPYLLTRYSGNTVFKNFTATFKKAKLPSVSFGYMPSSQLSEVNGQIYENFYQSLNLTVNHQYRIGAAQAFSLFSYNHFYNDAKDTGFLYYNAKNYYFNQHFQFLSYTTDVNIAQTKSKDYTLTVLDAGAGAKIWKQSVVGFGVKINQLNNQSLKVGIYGSEKISIRKLGELSAWIEKSYLPGWKGALIKTEFYNIGFFRVIN